MHTFWGIIAVIAALAIAAGVAHLIHNELRALRMRQATKRLDDADPRRNGTYARFDQDQMLRNRSERWD